jgi:hypothetical protein
MPMEYLTVKLVEEIQEAAQMGVAVDGAIARLQHATLPALLEYGCLRWATNGTFPPLPQAVEASPLGQALLQVRSELGLRSTGPQKPRLKRLDTQPIEFHVIDGRDGFDDEEWGQFEIRFDRSAQSVGFPAKKAHALHGALHEMAENAVIHAEAPTAILVGYQTLPGMALFCVADVGIGVLASLRSHPAYQHLQLHKDAIRAALHDGTTRFGPNTRGTGFRQVFKALAAQWGYLRFRSGNGCVTLDGQRLDADQGEETFPPQLPGFQVTVCCRTSAALPAHPLA